MKQKTIHQATVHKTVRSPQETAKVAVEFSKSVSPGEVVAFYGELGSGKTFFVKVLCKALGTRTEATSPSFTIMNEYQISGDSWICHFDFYRIEKEAELLNLGLDEFFYGEYICLIEWAEKVSSFLPPDYWEVKIHFVPDQPEWRRIEIQRNVRSYEE